MANTATCANMRGWRWQAGVASDVVTNGMMIDITGDAPEVAEYIETGRTYLDGSVMIGARDGVVRDRIRMALNGHVHGDGDPGRSRRTAGRCLGRGEGSARKGRTGAALADTLEADLTEFLDKAGAKVLRDDDKLDEARAPCGASDLHGRNRQKARGHGGCQPPDGRLSQNTANKRRARGALRAFFCFLASRDQLSLLSAMCLGFRLPSSASSSACRRIIGHAKAAQNEIGHMVAHADNAVIAAATAIVGDHRADHRLRCVAAGHRGAYLSGGCSARVCSARRSSTRFFAAFGCCFWLGARTGGYDHSFAAQPFRPRRIRFVRARAAAAATAALGLIAPRRRLTFGQGVALASTSSLRAIRHAEWACFTSCSIAARYFVIRRRRQGKRLALTPRAACATDAVHVIFGVAWARQS